MRPKRPRISLCMIAKDEEQFLEGCLSSVKGFVDEMVVVDTGSSDRTVEIAERFGARVYHHPWENDFSKHKNQAISYANGDWIFVMDADEQLKEDSGPVIRKATVNQNIDAILVTIVSYFNNRASQSWESKVRIFRNKPSIRYEGIVHEQLTGYGFPRTYPVCLTHYGYDLDKASLREKHERTSRLLRQQIDEDPDNYWHHHNLAVAYASNFMFRKAILEGKLALDLAERNDCGVHNLLWTHYILSSAFFKVGELGAAERYSLTALELSPIHLDSYFMLVLVYHRQKNWERLLDAAQRFLHIQYDLRKSPEKFAYLVLHSAREEWRVRLALSDLYLREGNRQVAEKEFREGLAAAPDRRECYRIMGDIYRDNGLLNLAEDSLGKALQGQERHPAALYSLAKIQKAKGEGQAYLATLKEIRHSPAENTEVLLQVGREDLIEGRYEYAASIFEQIIRASQPTCDILTNLALAYKYLGRYDDAVAHSLKALEVKDDSIETLSNLGHIYFELRDFQSAIKVYERAIELEPGLPDVCLRLASAYLSQGNPEGCITQCDGMLKALDLPRNFVLDAMEDLATVFLAIAGGLSRKGNARLSEEAVQIAAQLAPDLVREFQRHPEFPLDQAQAHGE